MHKGSCLCGAISFEVEGELAPGDACHCDQCRRWSGHYWASTNVPRDRLAVRGMDNVTSFQSSGKIRRGSCRTCGSALFWDPRHRDWTSIALGAFDNPTGAHLEMHIHVGHKGWSGRIAPGNPETCRGHVSPGHYYAIADGLPQRER